VTRPLLASLALLLGSGGALAASDPFIGVYHGQGRACFGGLFLRERTLEWNASFFRCAPTRYRRIAQQDGARPRVALELSGKAKACRFKVVEIAYYSEWSWTVNGYPSLEAYARRDQPGWKDSDAPERQIASCGMRKD